VASLQDIKRLAREAIGELAADRPEFGRRMRELIPSLSVYPYRLRDGGPLVLRARLVLNLASLISDGLDGFGADGVLRREHRFLGHTASRVVAGTLGPRLVRDGGSIRPLCSPVSCSQYAPCPPICEHLSEKKRAPFRKA
jgi:hypothetical protein